MTNTNQLTQILLHSKDIRASESSSNRLTKLQFKYLFKLFEKLIDEMYATIDEIKLFELMRDINETIRATDFSLCDCG